MTKPREMPLDGKTIMPLLEGKEQKVHDCIYAEIGYARTIKTDKWKYISVRYPANVQKQIDNGFTFKSYKGKAMELPYLLGNRHLGYYSSLENKNYHDLDQLYNLKNDPTEQNNLFGQHPEIEQELKKQLSFILKDLNRPFGEFN